MTAAYQHIPHPRIQARKATGPVRTVDQRNLDHPNPLVRFNNRFGLAITVVVGTMWCAYLFTALALVSIGSAFSTGNLVIIVGWIAQTFLQLVLLPVIIVGQNIQAKAADKRAEDTYNDADAVLHEVTHIQKHLQAQDEQILAILKEVEALRAGPQPS
ncbi:MAG TPA: hypothetical protein VFH58_05600 [Acidimicrobiales bacterium]|nr:hypothetical protein [Acidimicrobiales bacterium]